MYKIMISDEAQRKYKRLGRDMKKAISRKITQLEGWPEVSAHPLWGAGHGHYRVKARDYRVIFHVDEQEKTVYVDTIRHRSEGYGEYH